MFVLLFDLGFFHPTRQKNGSFQRRSLLPFSQHGTEENKPNANKSRHAPINDKKLQYNMNIKLKPGLCHMTSSLEMNQAYLYLPGPAMRQKGNWL